MTDGKIVVNNVNYSGVTALEVNEIVGNLTANDLEYNDTETQLGVNNIQDAIDELHKEISLRALKKFEVVYMVDSGQGYREEVQLGSTALLPTSFTPAKEGYSFIGWRKDNLPLNDVLTECTVGEEPIILYAVFRKGYKTKFISYQRTEEKTGYEYYNNAQIDKPDLVCPTGSSYSGWTWRGWSPANNTSADSSVVTGNGGTIADVSEGSTFYGLYQQNITISFNGNGNTGGSTASITKTRYYNAYGNILNPTFTLPNCGFTRSYGTFQKWCQGSLSGTQYAAGATVTLSASTTYYVQWLIQQSGTFQKGVPAE